MTIAILCQEEPVFLAPFLIDVIERRPSSVAAVFVAGRRSAGEPSKTWRQRLTALRSFWLIFEPHGFVAALCLRARAALLGGRDPRSVARAARRRGIPVLAVADPNAPEFRTTLSEFAPDAVLNQSELLLKSETLAIPRLGFVNRHASLLPSHRGRLASFWSHADREPRYGVTIHLVDEGVDTGPILLQQEFDDIDPRQPYPAVMQAMVRRSAALFWEAVDRLADPQFSPQPQPRGGSAHRFPRLEDVRAYRRLLSERRRGRR